MSTTNDYSKITRVSCGTTVKDSEPVVMEFHHDWSPLGVEHVLNLFREGFYDGVPFFRVISGFLVQFGLVYDKELQQRLGDDTIKDDPQLDPPIKFRPGIISYAGSGPDSRTSHLFVSYGSASGLGTQPWETPLGKVTSGMETLKALNSEYGDKPNQNKIRNRGKEYIEKEFPNMHHMTTCIILQQDNVPVIQKEVNVNQKANVELGVVTEGGKSFLIFSAVGLALACFFVIRRILKVRGGLGRKTS